MSADCNFDYINTTSEQWLCENKITNAMAENCYCTYSQNCTIYVPPGSEYKIDFAPIQLKNHSRDCYED